jgi:hypothetical protein
MKTSEDIRREEKRQHYKLEESKKYNSKIK